MENRWRFLYPVKTELWGHGRKARAGSGEPGRSGGGGAQGKPRAGPGAVRWTERKVGKLAGRPSRKAAIALCRPVPETDTGGRGENPKADGRSVVKELGKMAP